MNQGRVWHITGVLNIQAMISAASMLCGTYDFSSFRASDCAARDAVRTIHSSEVVRLDNSTIQYRIQGNGFLKQMVRTIVGTLVDVGLGKKTSEDMRSILSAKDRSLAGQTAPAKGLTLEWVHYS